MTTPELIATFLLGVTAGGWWFHEDGPVAWVRSWRARQRAPEVVEVPQRALPPGPSTLVIDVAPEEDDDEPERALPAVAFRRCRWDRFEAARYTEVPWCTRGHPIDEGQEFWAIEALDEQGPGELAVCVSHAAPHLFGWPPEVLHG